MTVDTRPRAETRSLGRLMLMRAVTTLQALAFPVIATILAFSIGAVVILLSGQNPLEAYRALLRGGFGSMSAWGRTLLNATPLLLTGLAVAVPFRAGLFNIGGEGQLFIGAIAAAAVALLMPGPAPLVIIAAVVAATLGGLIWGGIPGALKSLGAHEVIVTIMLNFVAINLVYYLAQNPLSGEGQIPGTDMIGPEYRLAQFGAGLGRAHWGFALALVAALAAYLLIWRTTRGFAIRAVGLGPEAARYAGIPLGANGFLAIAVGGLFAGLGGGLEVLGVYGRVSVPFVTGLGFTGIGVALLGRNHPVGVVIGALFFGGLAAGAQEMQFSAGVPLDLADVLLAIVLLFVTATKLVELILGRRARSLAAGTKLEKGLAS
ncbi:MAG: ABC transporter permease [Nitriliruptorales bacterium]|nr:ABC transporter permease [Nitriliruptorales bacterium]